ncbi:CBS domain containing-hemolysin-like protein [Paenibacillus shirakamiensis]|uniref:CBS domain containing-hemolysin-like protein n=1 Tax=Paenibacillus shirakamiensis TaxID=1265935 RepID=A0ABS4JHF4_9BACL|nr:CBS domain containing-hemolysin-like protein [Paenibacillus shirakamiensis]
MESDSYGLNLVLIAILICLTAFFVAVEFAVVRIRPSRIDQLIAEDKKNAHAVKKVLDNMDGYLSACQLGITITSLGLGWLGEPTMEKILHPLFNKFSIADSISGIISVIIAFALITYLHVVVGELAPKTVAIRKAEWIALITAKPIIWFSKVMFPFIWLLNGSANQLVRIFGIKPASEHEEAHSEEELRIILSESLESGKINQAEYGYVNRIFAFDNLMAKDIMVPRTDMICLYAGKSRQENLQIIKEQQYTRFPVVQESKDNVIGIVNTKQFFLSYEDNPNLDVATLMQPVMAVPEFIHVNTLLKRLQKSGTNMAILIDEYGGTSGLVTIEDILEQIVGEIRDEFDTEEEEDVKVWGPGHILVNGKVSVSEVSSHLSQDLDSGEWDTIGGWLYGQNSELAVGESYIDEDYRYTVRRRMKSRYLLIEIIHKDAVQLPVQL